MGIPNFGNLITGLSKYHNGCVSDSSPDFPRQQSYKVLGDNRLGSQTFTLVSEQLLAKLSLVLFINVTIHNLRPTWFPHGHCKAVMVLALLLTFGLHARLSHTQSSAA